MKQQDRLELAAALALRLGRMDAYCEAKVLQGEWAAAVSAAPAVSLGGPTHDSGRLESWTGPQPARS